MDALAIAAGARDALPVESDEELSDSLDDGDAPHPGAVSEPSPLVMQGPQEDLFFQRPPCSSLPIHANESVASQQIIPGSTLPRPCAGAPQPCPACAQYQRLLPWAPSSPPPPPLFLCRMPSGARQVHARRAVLPLRAPRLDVPVCPRPNLPPALNTPPRIGFVCWQVGAGNAARPSVKARARRQDARASGARPLPSPF